MNGMVSSESRIGGSDIFVEDLPILKAVGDGKGERSYALCARDGTIFAEYGSEELSVLEKLFKFYEKHKDEISVSKHRQFIDYLVKEGEAVKMDITLDQFGVHLFNSRYVPTEKIKGFEQLVVLAERGQLLNEIIVTPVDSKIVKAFKYIAESAEKHGRDPVNALAGILCRRAVPEGDELVVLEDDRLYQLAMRCGWEGVEENGRMRIKYLIVDGYIRFVASLKAFEINIDKWRKIPTINAVVIPAPPSSPKKPALGMDPLTAFYFSVTANAFARDINEDLSRFIKLFQAGDVIETLGKRMRFLILAKLGEEMKTREDFEKRRKVYVENEPPISIKYDEPIEESVEEKRPEEEKREERRWERREEPAIKEAMRPAVSEAQRQFAPTYSYAPAQRQTTIQMPMSHPASAQPIREEAQKSGQTQPVQLNEISVLSVVLDQYLARHNPQAHYYVFQGKGIDVRLDYNLKKVLENSGLSERSIEVDIRYTDITDFPVRGMQLKAKVYVPVAWGKYCSNCGHLIVLSPMRCVFCGEVTSPLPYVVSYKPAGT
jgi:flagellar biosynthesis GTPase FlhF